MNIQLHKSDCLEIMKDIPDKSGYNTRNTCEDICVFYKRQWLLKKVITLLNKHKSKQVI